jgi:hypothetical protein
MTSYVYDGTEVKRTGREAIREIRTTPNNTRKLTLVEIEPVDPSFDWKKWVDPSMLFVVQTKED